MATTSWSDGRARCTNCGRNFADDRIATHREICQNTKKRKVYDMAEHRVQGTDSEQYVPKKKFGPSRRSKTTTKAATSYLYSPPAAANDNKNYWHPKHEESGNEMQAQVPKRGRLPDLPPPPPSENPDYVQCPHCSRRFNQTAAERHIPKCAAMLHNKPTTIAWR